jgi:antitoxin (DNA-binding transcriptional repressor) of toxin-antitoxin stability system
LLPRKSDKGDFDLFTRIENGGRSVESIIVRSWRKTHMQSVTLQESQSHLAEIIDNLPPGAEVVITREDKPVATIRAMALTPRKPRQLGTLRGSVLYMAPDFDAIPEGFEEYVECRS